MNSNIERKKFTEHLANNDKYFKLNTDKDKLTINNIIFDSFSFNGVIFKIDHQSIANANFAKLTTIEFNNCIFNESIKSIELQYLLFNKCKIKSINHYFIYDKEESKYIEFFKCKINRLELISLKYISNMKFIGGSIKFLNIENNNISSKFYINQQSKKQTNIIKIDSLLIKDSIFNENFKIHNADINKFLIIDCDFNKDFDFFKSKFKNGKDIKEKYNPINEIYFSNLNIKGLSIFDDTKFENKVIFEYCTFNGAINFRNAHFKKGLNLDTINIDSDKNINFYNIKGLDSEDSILNTSQETYRIIKFSLEQIGNKIDANKYHSLELNKNKVNLLNENKFSQRSIVSQLHYWTSNHSQNWLLTLVWIFIVGALTTNLCLFFSNNCPNITDNCFISIFKHSLLIDTSLFDKEKVKGIGYIILAFNKITLGYLYYQFLTAVRKDTRK